MRAGIVLACLLAFGGAPAMAESAGIAAARAAARADRNAEAAALFAQAGAGDAGAEAGLQREYADQLTYSGQAARAVAVYRRIIPQLSGAEQAAARRGLALALLWSGDSAAAVGAWQAVVAADPEDADARGNLANALVDAARAAARADRNREAADRFARALAVDPSRRGDLLAEYADQLTYSDRSALAVPMYREILSRGEDDRILGQLALALAWSGQLPAALAAYDRLLEKTPGAAEARLGRAQVLGWMGRNAEAAAAYRAVLVEDPANRRAVLGAAEQESYTGQPRRAAARLRGLVDAAADRATLLVAARAELWSGRPDRAEVLARRILAAAPGDAEAAELLRQIAADQAPRVTLQAMAARQGDGQAVQGMSAGFAQSFNHGLTVLGAEIGRQRLGDGAGRMERRSVRLSARQRLGDAFEINGIADYAWLDGAGATRFGYDLWLTWWPNDAWRVDASLGRGGFEDMDSLRAGVVMEKRGLSVDYRPVPGLRLTARAQDGRISDGNRRREWQIEAEMQPELSAQTYFGARATWLDFARPELATGYWNPDWMQAVELTGRTEAELAAGWRLALSGRVGVERLPEGRKLSRAVTLGLRHDLGPKAVLRAEISAARTGAQDGFNRLSGGLGVDFRW